MNPRLEKWLAEPGYFDRINRASSPWEIAVILTTMKESMFPRLEKAVRRGRRRVRELFQQGRIKPADLTPYQCIAD